MPLRLDAQLLAAAGVPQLPKQARDQIIRRLYESLQFLVGRVLVEEMSEQDLAEFEAFIDASDEEGALEWLERNFPNYRDVVHENLGRLLAVLEISSRIARDAGLVTGS